jgi:hypothetical protein
MEDEVGRYVHQSPGDNSSNTGKAEDGLEAVTAFLCYYISTSAMLLPCRYSTTALATEYSPCQNFLKYSQTGGALNFRDLLQPPPEVPIPRPTKGPKPLFPA